MKDGISPLVTMRFTVDRLTPSILAASSRVTARSSVAANSRMIWAFARDGALPGSALWHRVDPRTRTPTNAVWLAAGGAFCLGLPYLWNATAYAAVTSIAVIGLYVAYVTPVFLRVLAGDRFERGPWTLGRWGKPVGTIATIWVVLISILFMLPQATPITVETFNYTPIVFVVVVFGGLGSLSGCFIASLLIGIMQTFAVALDWNLVAGIKLSQAAPALPYLLMVLLLIFRPKGLLGTRED